MSCCALATGFCANIHAASQVMSANAAKMTMTLKSISGEGVAGFQVAGLLGVAELLGWAGVALDVLVLSRAFAPLGVRPAVRPAVRRGSPAASPLPAR